MSPDTTNPTAQPGSGSGPDRVPVQLDELDRERRLRGWTKARLAKEMGVGADIVSDLYRSADASPEVFGKLAAALHSSPPLAIAERLMGEAAEGAA